VEPKPTPKKIIGIQDFLGPLEVNHHANPYGVPQKPLPEVGKKYKTPEVFRSEFSLPLKNGWERKEGRKASIVQV